MAEPPAGTAASMDEAANVIVCITLDDAAELFDQVAHLFKHPALGIEDINDVWRSDPLFY